MHAVNDEVNFISLAVPPTEKGRHYRLMVCRIVSKRLLVSFDMYHRNKRKGNSKSYNTHEMKRKMNSKLIIIMFHIIINVLIQLISTFNFGL